ncbi:uncharacterized protein LOC121798298 [Salvia splendens]|nr:uncharacterized protein LOC121798298 [Salvia splendens]XP_042053158.1 uncharacterized protein LOC121798298 [Salvia splendens]XP_042053159.1 uncharacterized protein LOC121798298 [Salvia splendens]XP_042053160.1 uncharacterized protein LOC121798298 [Salvia splendens]XP_042053161.1 uncharacterized protein LOC121798298 [Salvia splendens]
MHKNMETNTCNVNHLDVDAHLPPRKRLLAGLKRQNSDVNSPTATPSTPSSGGSEHDVRSNNALRSHLHDPSLSNEEIVEISRIAAMKAAKVAEVARANAEEKAAKAAKAVAAAKSALDLVAILSDETGNKEKLLKKNKMKKHVTVEALYNKNKSSPGTDEELARNLHRVINSSPRILKNSPGSESKSHKHKKLKSSAASGRTSITNEAPVGEGDRDRQSAARSTGNGVVELDTESPVRKIGMIMVDLNTSKHDSCDQLKLDNGDGSRLSKTERLKLDDGEVLDSISRKRGRIKQKKLPLSICSFKDQTSPKEELKPQGNAVISGVDNQPLFSMGPSSNSLMPPVERTSSMWKCQSFKAPACVKQNKVMQS